MPKANDGFWDTYKAPESEIEQLRKQVKLLEMSNSALKAKLAQVQKTSKSRLERMKRRGKLLDEAQRTINRLRDEAHGG